MHDDGIPVPEIDGGQVAGENLLDPDVVRATAALVRALGCVIEQGIELRIRVVPAVVALGRKISRS
jgi:hypothetical protein